MTDEPYNPVADQIRKLLARSGLKFRETGESFYDAEAFGNALFDVELEDLRLRFVSDKGQEFLELCALWLQGDWQDLLTLVEALGLSDLGHKRSIENLVTFENLLDIFVENHTALEQALSHDYRLATGEKVRVVYEKIWEGVLGRKPSDDS